MVKINIAGTVYEYPDVGENPNWGREATEVIVALAEALNSLVTDGDILLARAAIQNNISVFSVINGLILDSNKTKSATISYTVTRKTSEEYVVEYGSIYLLYEDTQWIISRELDSGDAGIIFEIDNTGQLYYQTTNLTGINHIGLISFSAKTTPK